MRNFLKWGIFAFIAIAVVTLLAYGFATDYTGRARDDSVAALRQKLAEIEAEEGPVPANDEDVALEGPPPAEEPDLDPRALRTRWRTLFTDTLELSETCRMEDGTHRAVFDVLLGLRSDGLSEEERAALEDFLACTQSYRTELLALCNAAVGPAQLYDEDFRALAIENLMGFYRVERYLGVLPGYANLLGDHRLALEGLGARLNAASAMTRYLSRHPLNSTIDWPVVLRALESDSVPEMVWDALLDRLARHRLQSRFSRDVRFESASLVEHFEAWPASIDETFSEAPISYGRNWAYRYITTPLFNHDLDEFSRAMNVLVDLAARPYFEVKTDLEMFYRDFDVEADPDSIKVIRGNPAWRYVLELSRVDFPAVAREQATVDIARMAILLDRYHRANGAYPEGLEVLKEGLGGAVPRNPLNGEEYIYTRDGETFHLGFTEAFAPSPEGGWGEGMSHFTFWNDPGGEISTDYVLAE